ncbi:TIGR02206 family membrane protein [Ferrimicrobium acidiphilum]|uniref:YwaF family protein n=1 Tax=Ferrimicrobium acidiphilum TaxID=121039 RepID=UPI0023F4359E|nr:TIGR02206 family membrane protein [Ferrimicrobium acidiphilum]
MTPTTLHYYIGGIVVAIVATVVFCRIARVDHDGKGVTIARFLSILLLAKGLLWFYTIFTDGPWRPSYGLPLYLCDIAVFVAAAACWWRTQLLVEVLYFWALAGVIEGIITPDLPRTLPSLLVFQYTLGHLAVVVAAIYLVVGLQIVPNRFAVVKVYIITVLYTAFTAFVDWSTGGNYMFLRRRPHSWSILNLFGPWPWYIAIAGLVALVFFLALNLPFWFIRAHERQTIPSASTTEVGRGYPLDESQET